MADRSEAVREAGQGLRHFVLQELSFDDYGLWEVVGYATSEPWHCGDEDAIRFVRELHDQGAAIAYRQSWPDSARGRPAEPVNLTTDELAVELEAARGRDGPGAADVWLRITEEGLKEVRSKRP